jgi:hypothetical protein
MQGKTVEWMQTLAKAKNSNNRKCSNEDQANYYNRDVVHFSFRRNTVYDKRHLFTLAGEDEVYR